MATESRAGTPSPQQAAQPSPAAVAGHRPLSLWAAAALLVLLGTLLALTGLLGDDASLTMLPFGVAVAASGVLPLVRRTAGWWVAVVACGLLVMLMVVGLAGEPQAGLVIGLCWVLAAGGLLALAGPGTRRHSPDAAADPGTEPTGAHSGPAGAQSVPAGAHTEAGGGDRVAQSGEPLRRPDGWTREWGGGWVKLVAMALFGVLCLLVGLGMTGASFSDEPGAPGTAASLLVLAFGVTVLSTLPMFWPRRNGRPDLRDLPGGRGVSFGYSTGRKLAALVGACAFCVCGVVLVVAAETLVMRAVGVLATLLFGFFAWYVARNRAGRWAVVATPSGIGTVDGPGAVVVPWDAVRDVVADETTTYVRGMPNREPHIAVHTEAEAVRHQDAVDSALANLNRSFTDADLVVPVRALGVDPALVLAALRHYLRHPDQRAELGDRRALERIARRDLDHR